MKDRKGGYLCGAVLRVEGRIAGNRDISSYSLPEATLARADQTSVGLSSPCYRTMLFGMRTPSLF